MSVPPSASTSGGTRWRPPRAPITSRIAYAAAHVIPRADAETAPDSSADLDWEHTLGFRHHLWSWGLGVAEAMDTAQRGMGLDWVATRELIRRSSAEAASVGGRIVAGAGTDHRVACSIDEVVHAFEDQVAFVEGTGADVVLMASRDLARLGRHADDYLAVYSKVLEQTARPVILHWLGEMFDPALATYWGSTDLTVAAQTVLDVVNEHAPKVAGIKVSLLDAERERAIRAALPAGVRLFTGDDFHYDELIRGDGEHHSDALLGAFAAIAPEASAALQALDEGDVRRYDAIMAPTVPLSRHLFAAPTRFYKTGIAFLSWLNGFQPNFTMVGGLQSGRSPVHLVEVYRLARTAGVVRDVELAEVRLAHFRAVTGLSG